MPALLTTPRLDLTPWTPADLDAFHALWSDPAVIWWGPSASRDASAEILRTVIDRTRDRAGLGWWRVSERGGPTCVGSVMVQPARFTDAIEVGWHLHVSARGRGLATEAAGAVVAHAFASGIERLVAAVAETNAASHAVAVRLGFTRVAELVHAGLPLGLYERRADHFSSGARSG